MFKAAARLFAISLLLCLGALTPALASSFGKAGCEALLQDIQIAKIVQPLLRTLDQITDQNAGADVETLVRIVRSERQASVEKLMAVAETTDNLALKKHILNVAPLLTIPSHIDRELDQAIALYGSEVVPEGPTPLPTEVYEIWGPRFRDLSRLAVSIQQFGKIGELLAIAYLPGVTQASIGPNSILSSREQHFLVKQALPADQEWLRTISRANFEIDVVFNEGRSVGEVKFAKSHRDETSGLFAKIKKQSQKLGRLARIFQRENHANDFGFIFVGAAPTEAMKQIISAEGLSIIHIPFDFGDTK